MFKAIKDACPLIDINFKPSILVADNAPAITNGFASVFTLEQVSRLSILKRSINQSYNQSNNIDNFSESTVGLMSIGTWTCISSQHQSAIQSPIISTFFNAALLPVSSTSLLKFSLTNGKKYKQRDRSSNTCESNGSIRTAAGLKGSHLACQVPQTPSSQLTTA